MANTDKDIVITPNKGETASPIIEFSAANSTTGAQIIKAEAVLDDQDKGMITFTGDGGLILTIADGTTNKLDVNGTITSTGLTIDGSNIVFEGSTANDFETTFTVTDPTADRTITFQDASGTVAFISDITSGGSASFTDITIEGSNIVFEGATADANETTLTVTDPTADRTITLPDASGTVAVSVTDTTTTTQGDLNLDFTLSAAGDISATGDAHGLATTDTPTFAGLNIGSDSLAEYISDTVGAMVTSNTESGISVTYQDADNTLDFDVGDFSITLTGDVTGSGTVTNLANVSFATTIAANSVALGTDTTGDYVASLIAGALIDLQNNTGESSTPTIDVDLSELTDMTAAAVGTDELVILDAGLQHRKAINEIPIGIFDTADQIALGTDTTGNYVATISGTANQVTVTGSGSETAAVTLSLPQNIHTGASPTFAGATLDNIQVGVTGANEIDTSSGNLTIDSAGGTVTIDDNVTVTGNLTVSGTTTTINTETINLADNIVVLNSNETGTPSQNSGIEIERGTATNVVLQWNETSDHWEIASGGTTGRILTTGDEGTGNGLDADTVDSLQASQFLRSDASDTTTGNLTIQVGNTNALTLARTATTQYVGITFSDPSASRWLNYVTNNADGDLNWQSRDSAGNVIGQVMRMDNATRTVEIYNQLIVGTDIIPDTDNTGNVGSADFTWNTGRFTNFVVDNELSVRGALDLADSDILRLGSSDDWEFFHNGTHNFMDLNVGDLYIRDGTTTRYTFSKSGTLTISNATGDSIDVSGGSPTIKLNDTTSGEDTFWIHVNANNFYVLTDRDASGSWETPHPLQLEADTNIGYMFGSRVFRDDYHPNADTWTTARTLTIGDTGKTVNGSGNVSWSRAELGITKTNIDALNIDADTLDSLNSTQFLRSDASDTMSGSLIVTGNLTSGDNGSNGYTILYTGSTANPGYLAFFTPDDTRRGYLGWNSGNNLIMSSENGWGWTVTGGDFTVDGGTLFVDASENKVGIGTTTGLEGSLTLTDYINIRRNTDGWLLKHERTDNTQLTGIKAINHSSTGLEFVTANNTRMTILNDGILSVYNTIRHYNGATLMGDFSSSDTTWFRINQGIAKNIYTPRMIRADGGFQVDSKQVISADGNTVTATTFTGNAATATDADKLDGLHASSFVRGDNVNNGTTTIRVDDADFVVSDSTDATTNIIWRDHSASVLYLGTANAVPTLRENLNANSKNITNANNITATGNITLGGNIIPDTDNTGNVGTDALTWNNGRFTFFRVDDTLTANVVSSVANVSVGGDVVPTADNSGNVGTAALTWNNGRFTNLTVDSVLTVRGAIDLADSDILRLGSGDDAELFHNGFNLYLDLNLGDFIIRDGTTTRYTFDVSAGSFVATGNIGATQVLTSGVAITSTNVNPNTDNTGNVGTASFTWANGRFTDFTVDNQLNTKDAYFDTTNSNPAANNVAGTTITSGGNLNVSSDNFPVNFNVLTDGTLVRFRSGGVVEGNINVSGTTVSYVGGHLARYSQLPENSGSDNNLLKGTVMTNLDEMCEWIREDGTKEDNEQLNKMEISSVVGDKNVAGVFVNWDPDEDGHYEPDMNIAMTGDMIIRIAADVTVERGDLLMSAGDGTAMPQGDDIVKSCTIAKVTSTHVTVTYDDGSYCVPCVLMAC